MTDERVGRLVHRFAVAARAHHAALEALDESGANAHARVIARLFAAISAVGTEGREALRALVESPESAVAGMAAVYSLRFRPEPCLAVLRRLAVGEGLLAFRAAAALERWETGAWELP
jgi:hypothetical protein